MTKSEEVHVAGSLHLFCCITFLVFVLAANCCTCRCPGTADFLDSLSVVCAGFLLLYMPCKIAVFLLLCLTCLTCWTTHWGGSTALVDICIASPEVTLTCTGCLWCQQTVVLPAVAAFGIALSSLWFASVSHDASSHSRRTPSLSAATFIIWCMSSVHVAAAVCLRACRSAAPDHVTFGPPPPLPYTASLNAAVVLKLCLYCLLPCRLSWFVLAGVLLLTKSHLAPLLRCPTLQPSMQL
jgi:hypothetical protein